MRATRSLAVLCWLALAGTAALAQEPRREPIAVAKESGQLTLSETIKGDESIDFVLSAVAGQVLDITLATDNASANFNVIPPASNEAMFIGSTSGTTFQGNLHAGGDYIIRVYLMRSAARRGESANFTLKVGLSGNATAAGDLQPDFADSLAGGPDFWEVTGLADGGHLNLRKEPSTSAEVLGQFDNGAALRNMGCRIDDNVRWCRVQSAEAPEMQGWVAGRYLREGAGPATPQDALTASGFNAEGQIKCSANGSSLDQDCAFAVMRSTTGAVVTVTTPDGSKRVLTYTRADQVFVADDGADLAWKRQDDAWLITAAGNQFYLIPDAVIFGG